MSRCTTPPQGLPVHCPSPLPAFRNLGNDLAGVIFTCTEDSLNDCLRAGVFGLPRTHFQYVHHVRPSMVLFLFNFSTRELHGIFRAITGGKIDGEPSGVNPDWAAKFPAQVHVDTSDTYPPLPESTFRRYIQENYLSSNGAQFSFELDMEQVALLSEAFKHFAISRTTPATPVQIGGFPTPSGNTILDRPSHAWLGDKTRRLSPVGHRTGLEFLNNYGRPRSSLDYLGTHQQHFETDLGLLHHNPLQPPRMSMDISSLNSLLSATANSQLLGNDPMTASTFDSKFFPNEPPAWNGETLNLSNLVAPLNTSFQPPLGLTHDNATSARLSMGRLSPGHLSPDLVDGWNADAAAANAFKLVAARLTPDMGISQPVAPSITSEERKRSSIWSVNSRDMGLVDQQKILSGVTFPEAQHEGFGLNGHATADFNASLQEPGRIQMYTEGIENLWSGASGVSWKPPRPHSSTDGEVQNLTKNLQNMWSDAKQQLEVVESSELYRAKSSSRASLSKGLVAKENNIDECEELSDGASPIESGASVTDKVNIGVLEAESRQLQFDQQNGEAAYGIEGLSEKSQLPIITPRETYPGNDIGLAQNGEQVSLVEPLDGLLLPNAPPIGIDFGLEAAGQDAALDEVSRLTLENEQLKIDRNQLQKQLNTAMKKKPMDYPTINALPVEGAMVDICLIGGSENSSSLRVMNAESLEEIKEIQLPFGFIRGASAVIGHHLFSIGGVDPGGNDLDKTYHIDLRRNGKEIVKSAASMRESRSALDAVSAGTKIFAIGGRQGNVPIDTVEIYDPIRDSWEMGPSLNTGRHSFSATVANNAIYAVGGHSSKGIIQSVEMLDPREGRWFQLGSLSWSRAGLACCPTDHHLFAVGGYNGRSVLATAEILDLRKGIVLESLTMNEPRQYGSAMLIGSSIYILGGVQNVDVDVRPQYSRSEIYNTLSNTSMIVSQGEQLCLVFHSASSVSCCLY